MSEQNMTSEIVSLRNENAVLKEGLALANQQLEWFRKQIFGRKTEQTSVVMLIAGQMIHADETTVQVLHEEGRKPTTTSRMWVYCNGKMNDRSIIIFEYQPARKGEHASNFLKGFIGYLICDRYDLTTTGLRMQ